MLSRGPRCSAFGEDGDGFVQGEGVGVIVLKPLSAALADGDRIEAVIRGSAMNAGGKTSGYTVPNPRAQAAVVAAALRQAGVEAGSIGYVECHGTGTSLGDPIEIAGLSDAFGQTGGHCAIGSVKSNIGHLEAAAGIAGLTKAVLQLRHRELVPSLHATPRNARIDFSSGLFAVQETLAPWPDGPRLAGVSSFGAGGANVHVVLEEAPSVSAIPSGNGPWIVPLSARDRERLGVMAAALREWLAANPADVGDVAYTLATGREPMEARAAFVVTDLADLQRQLASLPQPVTELGAHPGLDNPQALARHWTAGGQVDWTAMFGGQSRRPVPLPTYPFLRERHWLPDTPAREAPIREASVHEGPVRAGLLGEAEPTLTAGARWRVALDAADPIVAQHRVMGERTLPGVATIALVSEAAHRLGRGLPLRLVALTWLRPVRADARPTLSMRDTPDGWRFDLLVEGTVHATGLVAPDGATPAPADFVSDEGIGRRMGGADLYTRLGERGLDYGPAFRAIESLTVSARSASAVVRRDGSGLFGANQLDPGLLDAALQLTSVLIDEGAGPLPLPFAVGQVDLRRVPPADCRITVRRLDDGSEPGVVRFDAIIATPAGDPCVILHELAGRLRPAVAPVPPCYEPVWVPRDGVPEDASPALIFADPDHPAHAAIRAALPGARCVPTDAREHDADRIVFLCAEAPQALDRLRHLIQERARSHGSRPFFLTVLAPRTQAGIPPWTAAAFGLARVAGREFPSWSVRCVAVDSLSAIPAALADAGDPLGREVVWRDGRSLVRALRPVRPAPVRPAFRRDGVYVLLGGVGGIGLELAGHIASRHGARVALIGRTSPDPMRQARIDALQGAVAFFQADARDAAGLRRAIGEIRSRFGPITGAAHSAIVMEDQSLARMSDQAFHAAFDVKAAGTINLVDALAGETLDWFALFSSANSFAANAGQANYVAGCAFKDAYASEAAKRLGCPIRVINWGFWGEVGRVADPAYRERLARRGVQPIATAEGLAAVEAILGGTHEQLLVLKAEDRVLHELGVEAPAEFVDDATIAIREHAALDTLTRRAVAAWAATHPLSAETVAPRHRRLQAALAEMLSRAPDVSPGADPGADTDMGAEAAFMAAHPALRPHVALLQRCLDHYGAVLRDDMPATEVLFPASSMSLVEGIYRGDRLTTHCNGLVATAVRDAAVAKGRTVRVLEVGAGTGGTTAAVLAALDGTGVPVEYIYTDVSRAFALHGEKRFGAQYGFVRFGVLDLGRDPIAQGYDPASFDIVLGANVVHVTPDLSETAERLRRLLTPGGTLVLYEMTAVPDFATATFGLLDGWWAYTDHRLAHSPLLDAPGWSRALRLAGFAEVALRGIGGTSSADYRHTVIIGTAPVAERVEAVTVTPNREEAAPLIDALRAVVADTLQMRPEQLLPDRNFSDYGADSIISVDLIAALNDRFAITLKPTILFSHPTIERLAEHLASHHAVRMASPVPPPVVAEPVPIKAGAWADDIAIIGVSGRFPGADNVDTFWSNILGGVDSVGPVPRTRWDHAAIYDPSPGMPGRTQCPDGGFLDDVESFDPLFFNLSPHEATLMDPQQRLFLQEAWHALEDAGYAGPHPAHARCGLFVGTVAGDYNELLRQAGRQHDAQRFMGNAASMLAARIAYRLDLHGPCLSVDTACSSSLVALQLACESLQRGESDMALAGGVAVLTTPDFYVAASSAGMLSPTGRSRALDAAADGFVPGEAAAAVVLKRRSDAERDGDAILALIKAAGSNQDGTSNGITAPNGAAQTALLRMVHDRFEIDPASIGYVELHGTGTRLGDPIEMEGLRQALAGHDGRWVLGSVKANIGHTLPAAGISGLIKLMLVLRDGRIPPLAQFGSLNSHIDADPERFDIPMAARDWDGAMPRRGAISSFGFSGTNAHLVLEQPPVEASAPRAPARDWHLAVFSARDADALDRGLRAMTDWLDKDQGRTSLADLCGTLARGRTHLAERVAFVVRDLAELRAALRDRSGGSTVASAEAVAMRDLYLSGNAVDWERLYPDRSFRRRRLPTYPFERRRCWPVPQAVAEAPRPVSLFDAVIRDLGAMP